MTPVFFLRIFFQCQWSKQNQIFIKVHPWHHLCSQLCDHYALLLPLLVLHLTFLSICALETLTVH